METGLESWWTEATLVDLRDWATELWTIPTFCTWYPLLIFNLFAPVTLSLSQVNSASCIFASASFESSYQSIAQLLSTCTSLVFSSKSNFEKQVEEFSHWKIFIDLFCLTDLLMGPLSFWYFFFPLSDVFVKALLLPFNLYALDYFNLWFSFLSIDSSRETFMSPSWNSRVQQNLQMIWNLHVDPEEVKLMIPSSSHLVLSGFGSWLT